jgi:hypothetical protein
MDIRFYASKLNIYEREREREKFHSTLDARIDASALFIRQLRDSDAKYVAYNIILFILTPTPPFPSCHPADRLCKYPMFSQCLHGAVTVVGFASPKKRVRRKISCS